MTAAAVQLRGPAAEPLAARAAIIDIGSNSIRLVVYGGPARVPAILFNEKVTAGLGEHLAETGQIAPDALDAAGRALARFRRLVDAMGVTRLRTVATAAVRDASNGTALLARAAALGLEVELLSGVEEARAAALGVLSAIPGAEGLVGDLGGGSLELTRLGGGTVGDCASFPLGVLRLAALRGEPRAAVERAVADQLARAPWLAGARGLPLHLVGGSWRALARVDMAFSDYPLPIIHQYRMPAAAAERLVQTVAQADRARLRAIPSLSGGRIATLGEAALLLAVLVDLLGTSELVVSAYGLREGLLYDLLDGDVRAEDPLIAACRAEAEVQGRFREHGDLLDRWIAPVFGAEPDARLRLASCLLGDVGWRANPEFRAERALETAVHGAWVGVDARGRAMMGQALFTAFGGGVAPIPGFDRLASAAELRRAAEWGLAIRLGQRLSGGVAGPLGATSLGIEDGRLMLRFAPGAGDYYGDAVEKRHRQLAQALGLEPALGAA